MRVEVGLVMAVGALALLVGCGGGTSTTTTTTLSKQDYATKLEQAVAPLSVASQQLRAVDPSKRQEAATALAGEGDALRKVTQRIAALDPPSVATKSNAYLVTSLNIFGKSVARFEKDLRSGTKQQLAAQAAGFKAAQQAFLTTVTQIQRR